MRILALLTFAAALHAQPRGKIAIVRSPYLPTALDTAVKADVIEPVEIDSILPANLNSYDALFLQTSPSMVDSVTQIRFVNYLDSGGKLYIECAENLRDSTDFSNPLWLRFGIERNLYTDLDFGATQLLGTVAFTSNIFDTFPPFTYQTGYGGPSGNIIPIVEVTDGVLKQPLCFISKDSSIRMVYSPAQPLPNSPGLVGSYNIFISDVLCSYFNLCAEDVRKPLASSVSNAISIIPDRRYHGYSIRTNEPNSGVISLFDPLGTMIWRASIEDGASLIELPVTLRNSVYFVTVGQGGKTNVSRFAIIN